MKIDTLIFDMDGVITTEEKYWACARLTLWELVTQTLGLDQAFGSAVHDETAREAVAPDDLIYALKSRAVNSNWDIAYMLACIYLATTPGATVFSANSPETFLEALHDTVTDAAVWPAALSNFLATTHGAKGRTLIQEAGNRLAAALHFEQEELLKVEGAFWWYLHGRFQRFYHGEGMNTYGAPPIPDGTAIPADQIEMTLNRLCASGYALGTATGRPMDELNDALGGLGLLNYFDKDRFGTLDVVRAAEIKTNTAGLTKPHPYSLLRALYPRADVEVLLDEEFQKMKRPNVIMVGDTTSDVLMAKAAGCRCVGVLTGVRGRVAKEERRMLLQHAGCEAVLDDITQLPDWLETQIEPR